MSARDAWAFMAYLRGGLLVSSLFYISSEEDVRNFDFPMVLLCA